MARSLSNAKVLCAIVVDGISTAGAIRSRGYAAATQAAVARAARAEGGARSAGAAMQKKAGEDMSIGSEEKAAWVPDPVTGCYKPQNRLQEIDAAELLNRNN